MDGDHESTNRFQTKAKNHNHQLLTVGIHCVSYLMQALIKTVPKQLTGCSHGSTLSVNKIGHSE